MARSIDGRRRFRARWRRGIIAPAAHCVELLESRTLLANSVWAFPGADGKMLYQPLPLGDHIEDYSNSGYKGGTVPIPLVPVKAIVPAPTAGVDQTSAIQAAINSVSALPVDTNGFRGAVLLSVGTYDVATTINITTSGVILRGSGDALNGGGTVIHATGTGERTIINVNGSGSRSVVSGTTHTITDKYVPVGAYSFTVDSTAGLAVGDSVIVHRPSTHAESDCRTAFRQIDSDLREGLLVHAAVEWTDVFRRADELSEKHAANDGQRTIDLLHVAIAIECGAKIFLSFDHRQRNLARVAGLKTRL